jgi:hypothetical protein
MDLDDLLGGGHRGGGGGRDGRGDRQSLRGHDDRDDREDRRGREGQGECRPRVPRSDLEERDEPEEREERGDRQQRHGGFDAERLQRELLPRLLANKPALLALAGGAVLILVLGTWLLVTIIGALGEGGLRSAVESAIAPVKSVMEGVKKTGVSW